MERNEIIEKLMNKANITAEEAEAVLQECNWDVLDAIILLERRGKVFNNSNPINQAVIVEEVKEENREQEGSKKQESSRNHEGSGGLGEVIGRIFKFIGRVIKKGNNNYFEIKKENEKPIKISLTISTLLLVFLSVPTIILLILGLFFGYKYSLSGKDMKCQGVNDIFEGISKSADTIKKDFKEGYEN